MIQIGQVDWYGAKKNDNGKERIIPYGFIRHKDYSEGVFFHKSSLEADFLPKSDDWVLFSIGKGRDGKVAASKVREFNFSSLLSNSNVSFLKTLSENEINEEADLNLDENEFYIFSRKIFEICDEGVLNLTEFFLKNIARVFKSNRDFLDFSSNENLLSIFISSPDFFYDTPFSCLKNIGESNYILYATKKNALDFISYSFNATDSFTYFNEIMSFIYNRAISSCFLDEFRVEVISLLRYFFAQKKEFLIYFLSSSKNNNSGWIEPSIRVEMINVFLADLFSENKKIFDESISVEINDEMYYKKFDQENFDLINKWISYEGAKSNKDFSKKQFSYEQVKMMSARVAEMIAQDFFKNYGFSIEDVAISQVTGKTGNEYDWTLFDFKALKLESELSIDVKNARSSFGKDQTYSEFCIPEFKKNRKKEDVLICGIYSPYYISDKIYAPQMKNRSVKFLGVTNLERQLKLDEFFCKKEGLLESLSFERGGRESYLPIWLFSYPRYVFSTDFEWFSRQRLDEIEEVISLADIPLIHELSLKSENLNEHDDLSKKIIEIIFLKIFAFQSVYEVVEIARNLNLLSTEELDFYRILSDASIFTREVDCPVIFLSILTHFLKNISNRNLDYSFYEGVVERFSRIDTMNALKKLVENLIKIDGGKDLHKFSDFKIFKLQGGGLLQGRLTSSDRRNKTILAYCGGSINPTTKRTVTSLSERFKSRCGYEPLLITDHQSCPTCHKLICPECNTCAIGCTEMTTRIELIEGAKKLADIELQKSNKKGEPPQMIWDGYN
ncbi:MAG: cold shock domain-containing protein [Moraxellaceae bacterium]